MILDWLWSSASRQEYVVKEANLFLMGAKKDSKRKELGLSILFFLRPLLMFG